MPLERLIMLFGASFLASLGLVLAATFGVRKWALSRGFVDHPGGRRRHAAPTPNVGGIAVGLTTTVVFTLGGLAFLPDRFLRPEIAAMLVGGLLVLLLGVIDDLRSLKPSTKFVGQWVIASLVVLGGVRIYGLSVGNMWLAIFPTWGAYFATTFWIVGATNALNLIDGSDGVAAGAALFASLSLGAVFALNGDPLGVLMAAVLVGSCLGFLFFNFPPASIFLGDSGSLFLGYTFATLAVITTHKATTMVAVAIPIVAFAVPLLDTGMTIVRRFLRREPIFGADQGHVHHRLKDLGHSPRSVALVLYGACAAFAALSLALTETTRLSTLSLFLVAAGVLLVGLHRLRVPEFNELGSVLGRSLQQRSVIAHNIRLRSAVGALRSSVDGVSVVEALELAFEGSEFSRLEARFQRPLGDVLLATASTATSLDGDSIHLSMRFREPLGDLELEVRTPLNIGRRTVGHLSLYRCAAGDRVYTDLRLIPSELAPALSEALRRLQPEVEETPVPTEVLDRVVNR